MQDAFGSPQQGGGPLLVIDTAWRPGFLGLWAGDAWLAREVFSDARRQGEEVFPLLDRLLTHAGIGLAGIRALVVATGPGSFSALRVGLCAAKGLAETSGMAVVGVSLLDAAASAAPGEPRLVSIAASRGQAFHAVYGNDDRLEEAPMVSDLSRWEPPARVAPKCWVVATEAEVALGAGNPSLASLHVHFTGPDLPGLLAREGQRRVDQGRFDDPLVLDASYVRRDDADGAWTDLKAK